MIIQKIVSLFSKSQQIDKISKEQNEIKKVEVPEKNEPETIEVPSLRVGVSIFNFEENLHTIKDLIKTYRKMALDPEVEPALDEICDSAIVQDGEREVVSLDFKRELPLKIQTLIKENWEELKATIKFSENVYEWFKRWYIDGRLYFQILFNPDNPKIGVLGIKRLDPLNLSRVKDKETGKYFYLYVSQQDLYQIPQENILFTHSGIIDENKKLYVSNLHKAIKPLNQLDLLENSAIIYRFTRAPERRVFYIDVGKMPPTKAEQYVAKLMNRFRTKIVYDPETGLTRTNKQTMNMVEDFWIPRSDNRNTEIQTLPGGQQLGEMEDIVYFRKKLLKALKVPINRIDNTESPVVSFSQMGEITRDEIRFNKFIMRLRNQFFRVFLELLKRHLIMKNILDEDFWNYQVYPVIKLIWNEDTYFVEIKNQELLNNRLNLLQTVDNYVGKYFSKKYVYKKILKMNDEEIEEIEKQIEEEGLNENVNKQKQIGF